MALFTGLGLAISAALAGVGITVSAATVTAALNAIALTVVSTGLSLISNVFLAPKPKGLGLTASRVIRAATQPARWIMGEYRVAGHLIFQHVNSPDSDDQDEAGVFNSYPNNDVYLHMVYVIGKGAMESLEAIYIDGTTLELVESHRGRTPQVGFLPGQPLTGPSRNIPSYLVPKNPGRYREKVWVKAYFNADGVLAPQLHANTTVPQNNVGDGRLRVLADFTPKAPSQQEPVEKAWGADRKMNGLSYVYVILRRPDYISGGKLKIERNPFSGGVPDIQFRVKGNKITWPGQDTPIWTANAAAWRHWTMTAQPTPNWSYIKPELIDRAEFDAAYAKCEEMVNVTLPPSHADYAASEKRYRADGIIQANDEQNAIYDSLDIAWQGHVVLHQGRYYFRPGTDRPVVRNLRPEDIGEPIVVLATPPIQERTNSVTLRLDQSKDHEWSDTPLNDFEDAAAIAADGRRLNSDLGVTAYITSPLRGAMIMAIALKRARLYQRYTIAVRFFDDDMIDTRSKLNLKPTDVIRVVEDPENGFRNKLMRIVSAKPPNPRDGMRLILECEEYDPSIYNDDLVLPPLKDRTIHLPEGDTFTTPFNVRLSIVKEEDENGVEQNFLRFEWYPQQAYTEVNWRVLNTDTTQDPPFTSMVTEGEFLLIPITPGTWEYRLRHVEGANLSNPSDWTDVLEVTVSPDGRLLGAPIVTLVQPLPNGYLIRWELPDERYYDYTEVQEYDDGTQQWGTVGKEKADEFYSLTSEAEVTLQLRIRHVSHARQEGTWSATQFVTTLPAITGDAVVAVRFENGKARYIYTDGPWKYLANTGNALRTYRDTGLQPSTLRNYRNKLINIAGKSGVSNSDDVETDPA